MPLRKFRKRKKESALLFWRKNDMQYFFQKTRQGLILSGHFSDGITLLSFFLFFFIRDFRKLLSEFYLLLNAGNSKREFTKSPKRRERQRYGGAEERCSAILLCAVPRVDKLPLHFSAEIMQFIDSRYMANCDKGSSIYGGAKSSI